MFLSVAGAGADKFAPLDELTSVADAINHAIPTGREFEGWGSRLLQAGLIRQEERDLGLTSEGEALADRCNRPSVYWLDRWGLLAWSLKTKSFQIPVTWYPDLNPVKGRRCIRYAVGRSGWAQGPRLRVD